MDSDIGSKTLQQLVTAVQACAEIPARDLRGVIGRDTIFEVREVLRRK